MQGLEGRKCQDSEAVKQDERQRGKKEMGKIMSMKSMRTKKSRQEGIDGRWVNEGRREGDKGLGKNII